MARTVLQDHLVQVKEAIQATRNLKNREQCLEKGRREEVLKKIEADRRRVKARCEKEKEVRQSAPQNAWDGVVGTQSRNEGARNVSDDKF